MEQEKKRQENKRIPCTRARKSAGFVRHTSKRKDVGGAGKGEKRMLAKHRRRGKGNF